MPSLPVRPDGRISIPLVPEIMAAGKTPSQLGDELAGQLKKYVRDPIVTVMVQGFVGPLDQQVRVIGEATEPLAIPYRDGLTVLDVMIQTKGLTRYASGNRAVIVRKTISARFTGGTGTGGTDVGGRIVASPDGAPGDRVRYKPFETTT